MTKTANIIISNLKQIKSNVAKISAELIGDNTNALDSYKKNFWFDYSIDARLIARIIINNVDTFHAEISQRILDGEKISEKQRMALAYCYNSINITLGDVKQAITEHGIDLENDDFLFDD